MTPPQNALSPEEKQKLLALLQQRFEKNIHRHAQLQRADIHAKLEAHPKAMWSLHQMEIT